MIYTDLLPLQTTTDCHKNEGKHKHPGADPGGGTPGARPLKLEKI